MAVEMSAPTSESVPLEFTITADDFDPSLLPPEARGRATATFREAVRDFLRREFQSFGGYADVHVDDWNIQVTWTPSREGPDPLEQVIRRLRLGEYGPAVALLELFLSDRPDQVSLLYNLGIALSDTGKSQKAERYLRRAVDLAPAMTNARVALGGALQQNGKTSEAIHVLREAIQREPDNPWAQRNLGVCLMAAGRTDEAQVCFQRATQLNPRDQQACFDLAQSLERQGRMTDAYRAYRKVIDIQERGKLAEMALGALRAIAHKVGREQSTEIDRPDAVMYCLGAIERFETILRSHVQRIAFEIATLGTKGFDVSNVVRKYRLKGLPGEFNGLHLVCLMYVGFKIVAPQKNIGFDLSKEYGVAKVIHAKRG